MMFNLNGKGKPIVKITGGKYNDKFVIIEETNDKDNDELLYRNFNNLTLQGDAKFQPTPDTTRERDILYIAGPSGSGKSYFTKLYLMNYKKAYPNNPIYMFSKLHEDKSLEGIELVRVMIDNRLIEDPFDVSDFENCCVIMDDIDALREKPLKNALEKLKVEILETGRHFKTTLILTSHLACKGNETKSILNEAHSITFFLKSGMPVDYLLKNYVGLDKNQLVALKEIPSRFISITRGFPQAVFGEKTILFLSDLGKK